MKNPSAVKRHKQSEVRRMRNRIAKSTVRTMAKKYTLAIKEGNKDNATSLLKTLISKLDTIARKGIIKKNAASRKKSRMQQFYFCCKRILVIFIYILVRAYGYFKRN